MSAFFVYKFRRKSWQKQISNQLFQTAMMARRQNQLHQLCKPAVIQPAQSTTGGGEKTVAKDPKGMFDYSNCETYKVARGDKLIDVAFKYHVALQQLRYFNHLDKTTMAIKPDQILYIPNKPINVPVGK